MTVPLGQNTIFIKVEVGENMIGTFQNQATVSQLPVSLGEFTISDNPRTIIQDDSTSLEVQPLLVDLGVDSTELCSNESLFFDAAALANAPVSYEWNTGATTSALDISEAGTYSVTVTTGCEMVTDNIVVSTSNIDLTLGGEITIELGDSIDLIPTVSSQSDVTFQWTNPPDNSLSCLDCEVPNAHPFFDLTYYLDIINLDGCVDRDSIQLRVLKNRNIFIPNAFSPNFDGLNDSFFIQTKNSEFVRNFQIFDRWGNLVFQNNNFYSNDANEGWNGHFRNKQMNPAVFVYVAEVEFLDGYIEVLSGDVTLLRQ